MRESLVQRQLHKQVNDAPAIVEHAREREVEIAVLVVFRRRPGEKLLDFLESILDAPPSLVFGHHTPDLVAHLAVIRRVGIDERVIRFERDNRYLELSLRARRASAHQEYESKPNRVHIRCWPRSNT